MIIQFVQFETALSHDAAVAVCHDRFAAYEAIPGLIQFTIGNVIAPKVMGETLDLHPVTILLALIFWGMLWGMVGVFLAVPITAAVKILLEKADATARFNVSTASDSRPAQATRSITR